MKVLVGCEWSGRVRDAFIARGHQAWSCDLRPAPGPHLNCDVLTVLDRGWDLAIFHPDCTFLSSSAEWAYSDGPHHVRVKPDTLIGAARRLARQEALRFVFALRDAPIARIAIENPVGHLSRAWRHPDQILQPYNFGHDASKKTCLWLKNLPTLNPTRYVQPRYVEGKPRWGNQTDSNQNKLSPGPLRALERGITYAGIAAAMGAQWG